MRGTSSTSLGEVLRHAESALRAEIGGLEPVAEQLFEIADAIDSSNQLVRMLSDSGRPREVREAVVRELFGSRVGPEALGIAIEAVRSRWSEQSDLLEALELTGAAALLDSADRSGSAEQVEEELFEVSRLIDESPELSAALDDRRVSDDERGAVVDRLLAGRTQPVVTALVRRAVVRRGMQKSSRRVLAFAEFASRRRQQKLATVESARPLDATQQARLGAILARIYDRPVQMNLRVDPEVVGGLRIQVGDDLYDATVLARLARARQQLAS